MNGVHADPTRLALGVWTSTDADGDADGPGPGEGVGQSLVGGRRTQVVDGRRRCFEPLKAFVSMDVIGALQQTPRGGPRETLMGVVDPGQQSPVRRRKGW
ncbi:MAG: hypothetical protein IPN19_05310 [Elusimicrobia bacterium]|nr:hypothetical protein [Elusimicrobiota bacterium]